MSIFLVNKPSGPTSHDIVDLMRKITGEKRVGHAGTLDPFAEGLLIVLVGRESTKRQAEFMKLDKVYEATFVLGEERDTDDVTGKLRSSFSSEKTNEAPTRSVVKEVLQKFVGEIDQMPPAYSAKKIKGKKAYELARAGIEPELKPKKITIYSLKILDYQWPELKIRTKVSSGTYIRALARDMGRELGVGAYVKELRRTKIGKYELKNATTTEDLEKTKRL